MSMNSIITGNPRLNTGWIVLLLAAALMSATHLVLAFVLDDPVLFTGFAFFNLYALLVVVIPFRRGEKWSWSATWLLPIGLALPAALDPDIMVFYLAVAAVCVLGLLLTLPAFFSRE